MPNILYISRFLPSRKDLGGGGVRTKLLWEALKQVGDVYTVVYGKRNEKLDSCTSSYHPEHGYWGNMFEGRLWRLTGKICNLVINPCITPMRLDKWFPGIRFDFAVGRYFCAFNDVRPWNYGIPTLVDIDDHPLEKLNTAVLQGQVSWQSKLAMKLELAYRQYYIKGGWIVKENDKRYLRHSGNYDLLPNIPPEVHEDYNADCGERQQALLTVALFSYPPNRNGVDSFLQTIWPDVRRKYPDMEYWLIGGGLSEDYKAKWSKLPGVRLMGFVENLNKVYEQCLAVVVPVNQGAGSCIKTIEALSRGRIALSTTCGARGYEEYSMALAGQDGDNETKPILIYDEPSTFLHGLANYVFDAGNRQRLEEKALQIVKERFSFDKFCKVIAATVDRQIFL